MIVICGCFISLVLLVIWKMLGQPLNNWFVGGAIWAGLTSQALALPWLGVFIAAGWIEWRDWRVKPEDSGPRDLYLRESLQEERHARGLIGYSDAALVRVRHYLGRKVNGQAWVTSLSGGKVLAVAISLAGPYLVRHQIDPAMVSKYLRNHDIAPIKEFSTIVAVVVVVVAAIWTVYTLRRRPGQDGYQLAIVELALRLKQTTEKSERRRAVLRRSASRRSVPRIRRR